MRIRGRIILEGTFDVIGPWGEEMSSIDEAIGRIEAMPIEKLLDMIAESLEDNRVKVIAESDDSTEDFDDEEEEDDGNDKCD